MNLPNKLTVVRCVLTFVFFAVLLTDFPFHYGVALVLFIAASLTDYYDGKIARRDGLITNLGKFLDPLADKMLTTAAFLGFMVKIGGVALCWAVMLILTREFMVTSVRLLAAKDGVVVAASFSGKLKTVMQMVSIIYMLTALQFMDLNITIHGLGITPRGLNMTLVLFGYALIWISVIATVVSGVQYVWQLRRYFTEK